MVHAGLEPEVRPPQVFVDPSPVRAGLVRWVGRVVALIILAYLVLLAASLARAPWAPKLSLPGIGPVVTPNLRTAPPHLGVGAVTTPVPAAIGRSSSPGRSGGASTGKPGLGPSKGSGSSGTSTTASVSTTTSARGNSGHSSTTIHSAPGVTAPGRRTTSTTTAVSGGATTTTKAHGRGKP